MGNEKELNYVMTTITFQGMAVLNAYSRLDFFVLIWLISAHLYVEMAKWKEMKHVTILILKKKMDAH